MNKSNQSQAETINEIMCNGDFKDSEFLWKKFRNFCEEIGNDRLPQIKEKPELEKGIYLVWVSGYLLAYAEMSGVLDNDE